MIHFTCPCGKALHVMDEDAGRTTRCPDCGRDNDISPGVQGADAPRAAHRPVEVGLTRSRPEQAGWDDGEGRTRPATTSLLAVAGAVLGFLSLICCSIFTGMPLVLGGVPIEREETSLFFWCVFTGLPALILGVVGLVVISRSKGRKKGKGLAKTGIVAGTLSSVLLPVIVWLILLHIAQAQQAKALEASANNLNGIRFVLRDRQSIPPAAVCDVTGKPLLSWRVTVYHFDRLKLDEPWDGPNNSKMLSEMPRDYEVYTSPSAPSGHTYFRVFVGNGAAFDWREGHSLSEFTDGASNTILVAEAAAAVPWTKPEELDYDPDGPLPALGGHFGSGFMVLLADGSVRMVAKDVSSTTLKAAITRAAGDSLGPDWHTVPSP